MLLYRRVAHVQDGIPRAFRAVNDRFQPLFGGDKINRWGEEIPKSPNDTLGSIRKSESDAVIQSRAGNTSSGQVNKTEALGPSEEEQDKRRLLLAVPCT